MNLSMPDDRSFHSLGDCLAWHPGYWSLFAVLAGGVALGAILFQSRSKTTNAAPVPPSGEATEALRGALARGQAAELLVGDLQQDLTVTLASTGAGLIATDARGDVTRMNAVAERITGWRQDEAVGRSYWDIFVLAERPAGTADQTAVEALLELGVGIETAHRVCAISRTGARTSVEVKAELKRSADGAVRGMLAIIQDRTGLDRAEEDRTRLAAIVESSNDAIVGKTLDGRITSWNRGACDLFGYSEAEILGQSVQCLIPPDRRQEEMDILADIFDGKVVLPFETVRLAKDGRRLELSVTISPIRDASGRIVGGSKIARDIGPQRRLVAALREGEARLRFALEVARIGNWDLDLRTGAMHRSVRHDHCFGYAHLQPEWSVATLLEHVHPEDRDAVALSYRRALLREDDWFSEFRVVWPDESIHWLRIQGSTRYDTGDANRMLGIVSDVSDERRAEEARLHSRQLEIENRQIQESNRLKSQFLANMSHELRSPLNAIIGFSDLLSSDGIHVEKAKQRQFIGHIRTSGRHLLQLINDVLDLSKVESGKFEFFPERVNLAELIGEVRNVLFSLLQRKRLALAVEVGPEVASVTVDPARLKQVLFNYLSNAIKFTPDGGHISIAASAEGSSCFRIEVQDTGVGIAAEDLPRLFVEFQQLDASYTRQHQGTGLGLALTRRLVHAQGGRVGVRSVPGQGSTFHLVLPATPGASVDGDDADLQSAGGRPAGAGAHILVIEDDLRDGARIADALARCGHRVDVAADATQAIRQAASNDYDGLTIDLALAAPGGLEALARIRSAGTNEAAAVLAITLGEKDRGSAGFAVADVLTKPLLASEVILAMTRLGIAKRRGARVVVIDDDPVCLDLMRAALADIGIETLCFADAAQGLAELPGARPAAIVLDLIMPGMNGFEVLDRLRQDSALSDIPVFVWTSMLMTDAEFDLLANSAAVILRKGGDELEPMLERLRQWRAIAPRSAEGAL